MLQSQTFTISPSQFEEAALSLFQFQYQQNAVYRAYCDHLKINTDEVDAIEKIPFLPISFFKTHDVKTTAFTPEVTFTSSGTTGMANSQHHVKSLALYDKSCIEGFRHFYGDFYLQ